MMQPLLARRRPEYGARTRGIAALLIGCLAAAIAACASAQGAIEVNQLKEDPAASVRNE